MGHKIKSEETGNKIDTAIRWTRDFVGVTLIVLGFLLITRNVV